MLPGDDLLADVPFGNGAPQPVVVSGEWTEICPDQQSWPEILPDGATTKECNQ